MDREVLLHEDCGREEWLELEEEYESGDGVGRQAGDEPLGDAMDSTINGYWVQPTAVMIGRLGKIIVSQVLGLPVRFEVIPFNTFGA